MEEIKFNDLGAQYRALKKDIDAAITNVIADSRFISGPQVEQLEAELCAYTGRKYCVTCGNGTDALRMPLMAWGIKPGDAVFVPAFTFYASSEVISLCGATPVFVDSCPDTFNMDPEDLKKKIAEVKVTRKLVPRAIIAVDLFGQPAQFPEISQIAEENHLLLLEDGAQGFGGRIGEAHACSFGNASATSFFPAKALGCYGDGGAVFTDDPELYALLKSIRVHGKGSMKYENVRVGINSRLDTLQAAILLPKLNAFPKEDDHRNRAAQRYTEALKDKFHTPVVRSGYHSSFGYFTLRAENEAERTRAIDTLKAAGVPSIIYYPCPLHLQKVYAPLGYQVGSLPVAEKLAKTVFSLPMHGYISDETIDYICKVLQKL